MTDADANVPLPLEVNVTQSFASRLPSQRVLDTLAKLGVALEDTQAQPFRLVAFRALLRDYPNRDASSMWAHSYDVEVGVADADPTNGKSTMPAPTFSDTGA